MCVKDSEDLCTGDDHVGRILEVYVSNSTASKERVFFFDSKIFRSDLMEQEAGRYVAVRVDDSDRNVRSLNVPVMNQLDWRARACECDSYAVS